MTSYNDIFTVFVNNTGIDRSKLPTTDEDKYIMIHNAIMHYNITIDQCESKLKYDDINEIINTTLDDNRLLLLAYCLKYVYLENELVEFEELWLPFQKEIGIKNYKDQIQGREKTLERTNKKIIQLLNNIEDYNYN